MAARRRIERLQRQILRVVSQTVLFGLADPRVAPLITFTRVKLARDLSGATVFYSVLGDDAKRRTAQRLLEHARGHLQEALSDALVTRVMPHLRFEFDPAVEEMIALGATFKQIELELAESAAAEAAAASADATESTTPEAAETVNPAAASAAPGLAAPGPDSTGAPRTNEPTASEPAASEPAASEPAQPANEPPPVDTVADTGA